jgi:hypothetical protein
MASTTFIDYQTVIDATWLNDVNSAVYNGTFQATTLSPANLTVSGTSTLNGSVTGSGSISTALMGSGTASSSTFLRGDKTWVVVPSAAAGGSNAQVQFNSSGVFGGSSNFTFDGTNSVLAGSLKSINTFGFKNRIINGGFIINQRSYVSGTALTSGTYGHDRWKAGTSGCTYTFTQGSLGVNTTITITAGSLQQVIEGCNLAEGGSYILSWTGTAQARFNGGTYGSSPLSVTGITAGTNTTIEFNTGTVNSVQLEVGAISTGYDYRPYATELFLCQRYYEYGSSLFSGYGAGSASVGSQYSFKATKRVAPTVTFNAPAYSNCSSLTAGTTYTDSFNATATVGTTGSCAFGSGFYANAEL